MSETKTYAGGCHCGKVRYEVETDLGTVLECNCSICSKKGSLFTFVPKDKLKVVAGGGSDAQTQYNFNKHVINHLFCKACGVGSYATGTGPDGKEMAAINVRCLDDIDLSAIKRTPFDGKSR